MHLCTYIPSYLLNMFIYKHMHEYIFIYMCMNIHICIHICEVKIFSSLLNVRMHLCRRILFICTVQSLYYMRVYHRCFWTLACVCGGIRSGVYFSLFMVSACYWRGRLCFGRGRDRGFSLYISLLLRVLGWWVCVCLYTHIHTQTTWVLDVRPGVGRTPEEPEEPRSTTVHYTCRPLSLWFA